MKRHLGYLRYVLMHKWYVLLAGRKIGLGWRRALLHDLSKFSREEWGPYAHRFYDENGKAQVAPKTPEFALAVHLHRRRNPHHPQYWERPAGAYPFVMPEQVVIEMVADWAGAGRVKTGSWDIREWVTEAEPFLELHPDTKTRMWQLVTILGRKL